MGSRTTPQNVTIAKYSHPRNPQPVGSHSGHTIEIYPDGSVWCATDNRFITPEDLDKRPLI